jgi:hypothetical protein
LGVSELNLDDDYTEALAVPDSGRWALARPKPLEVVATILSVKSPGPEDRFDARLFWTRYPEDPPSLKFRDRATGRLDVTRAWPKVRGFRPASFDTCVNWTVEGFQLHPEWAKDPRLRWDPRGNVLLKVLRTLVDEMDNYFEGRHP